jgi:hypothetical protein
MDEDTLVRFMKNVVKTDSCWLWTGSKNRKGYATFSFENYVWMGHRLMYKHCFGELLKDMEVSHTCRNKCVNPDHLEQKTRSENNLNDKLRDGTLLWGENHYQAKLTNEQILDIKSRKNQTHSSIAKEFLVCRQTIDKILKGKTYKYI